MLHAVKQRNKVKSNKTLRGKLFEWRVGDNSVGL